MMDLWFNSWELEMKVLRCQLRCQCISLSCWTSSVFWFWRVWIWTVGPDSDRKVGPNSFCGHLISQSRMSLRCTMKIQDRSIPWGVLHQGPPFWPASATWQASQISPIWMYPPETGTTAHTNRDAIFTETSHSQCLLDSGCKSKKSDYRDWWNNIW